jgi:NTE family protein
MDIGLALGGGGLRGISHIGILKQLEKNNFRIKAIAGTSIGGLVGALYAAGYSSSELEKYAHLTEFSKLFRRKYSDPPSLLGLQGVETILRELLKDKNIEHLEIPFACTAVDIRTSQEIILSKGNVVQAVLATIAVPGIFPPTIINNRTLVDGGILDPVPVSVTRWLNDQIPIFAVSLFPSPETWTELPVALLPMTTNITKPLIDQFQKLSVGKTVQIIAQSIDTVMRMLSELRIETENPDAIMRPKVEKYGYFDNVDSHQMISLGEEAFEIEKENLLQAVNNFCCEKNIFSPHVSQTVKIIESD